MVPLNAWLVYSLPNTFPNVVTTDEVELKG